MKITRLISGGQTGADQGALLAARACLIPTGGWAPKGYLTEAGPSPGLASFGLKEHESSDYPDRTGANVAEASALVWFGNPCSPGGKLTLKLCEQHGVPHYVAIRLDNSHGSVADFVDWLTNHAALPDGHGYDAVTLMAAGNRESKYPGIALRTEAFLTETFRLLAKGDPA